MSQASREVTRCRHVKINGARCTMPSWKENGLCFEHNYQYQRALRRRPPVRDTFAPALPFVWVEDEDSVLYNLNLIAKALGDCEIDHRQAAAMTCVQRTSLRALRQSLEQKRRADKPEPAVTDGVEETGGQLLVLPAAPPDPQLDAEADPDAPEANPYADPAAPEADPAAPEADPDAVPAPDLGPEPPATDILPDAAPDRIPAPPPAAALPSLAECAPDQEAEEPAAETPAQRPAEPPAQPAPEPSADASQPGCEDFPPEPPLPPPAQPANFMILNAQAEEAPLARHPCRRPQNRLSPLLSTPTPRQARNSFISHTYAFARKKLRALPPPQPSGEARPPIQSIRSKLTCSGTGSWRAPHRFPVPGSGPAR